MLPKLAGSETAKSLQLYIVIKIGDKTYTGDVAELEITEVTVDYAVDDGPLFALSQMVELEFTGKRVKRAVLLDGMVVKRMESKSHRRYTYQFQLRAGQDAGDVFSIFNLRKAYRAPAIASILVEVLPAGDFERPNMKPIGADLADISASGIAIVVTPDGDRQLVHGNHLSMTFELPTSVQKITLEATIVYRLLLHSKAVRYGCVFLQKQRGFARMEDLVVDYVMTYQRKTLKYRGVNED